MLPPGTKYDVFRAAAPVRKEVKEKPAKQLVRRTVLVCGCHCWLFFNADGDTHVQARSMTFGPDEAPSSVVVRLSVFLWLWVVTTFTTPLSRALLPRSLPTQFTPDGRHLVMGAADGLVELYDFDTGKVDGELKYQADEEFIMCDGEIVTMTCSRDSNLLATGCRDGSVHIWNLVTGKSSQVLPKAHAAPVTALAFAKNGRQLLTGSSDTLVRLHGLVSGKMLKEFRGHAGCINDVKFVTDSASIVSCSSDGSVKFWDLKSTTVTRTLMPPQLNAVTETACNNVLLLPRASDRVVCCNRTSKMYMVTLVGDVVATFDANDDTQRFVSAVLSPRGKYLYGLTEANVLHCFNVAEVKVVAVVKVPEPDGIGVAHHPHMNLTASFNGTGVLRLWRSK